MTLLTGSSVVVCSKDYDYGPSHLTKYNLEYCKQVDRAALKHIPGGLSTVILGGKYLVAVAYV